MKQSYAVRNGRRWIAKNAFTRMSSAELFSPPSQRNDEIYIFEGDPLSTGETGLAMSSLLVPERNGGLVQAGSKFYP